jgi:hypothetical protein
VVVRSTNSARHFSTTAVPTCRKYGQHEHLGAPRRLPGIAELYSAEMRAMGFKIRTRSVLAAVSCRVQLGDPGEGAGRRHSSRLR